jgi:hypothetical protein
VLVFEGVGVLEDVVPPRASSMSSTYSVQLMRSRAVQTPYLQAQGKGLTWLL